MRGEDNSWVDPLARRRLSAGAYEHPKDQWSKEAARQLFLDAVAHVKPQVLEDLAGEPFGKFSALRIEQFGFPELVYFRNGWTTPEMMPLHQTMIPLHQSLIEWSTRWHLSEDWCRAKAIDTLVEWYSTSPDERHLHRWSGPVDLCFGQLDVISAEEAQFTFVHEGWRSNFDTEPEVRERMRRQFNEQLARYFEHTRTLRIARREQRAAEKRSANHFLWLAMYQVAGYSFSEICAEAGDGTSLTTKALGKALRETAALIDLKLRPHGAPGRPRRSSSQD